MKPRKKGQQYEVCYRCPGYEKPFYERFSTLEEANWRIAQIELDRSRGVLVPPKAVTRSKTQSDGKSITVRDFLEEYVQHYGLNHWGDSYLSGNLHRIEHYINPYLGDILLSDLTPRDLDIFYDTLQEKPAVILKGHTHSDAKIAPSVIERIHVLLKSALNLAVRWDYIPSNPAERVSPPKYQKKECAVWSPEEARYALDHCDDPILKLAMLLALGCSMRVGEILGLQWDNVRINDEEIEGGYACIHIDKEVKRCSKKSLEALRGRGRSDIIFTFPEEKTNPSTTSLVLKNPKTHSSIRTVYLPATVAEALKSHREQQNETKRLMGAAYTDYGLVLTHDSGRPYEARQILEALKKLIQANNLTPVVFHSLRHCSTSVKLQLSGGDIKAVQGDTGHAQARMVTEIYSHINHEDRRQLAQKVEHSFFQHQQAEDKQKNNAADETAQALELLQKNPDLAKLLVAAMGKSTS